MVKPSDSKQREVEFWFDFASNYSYPSVMRIGALAADAGVAVRLRPFLLGPIFKSFGWDNSPFVLQAQKGRYMWRDMERECGKYGVPWNKPSVFPRLSVLPARVAISVADAPWVEAFCRDVMLMNFSLDKDISDVKNVGELLTRLGQDSALVLAGAKSDMNKLRLRQQTEEAADRGVFGAPMFFVGDEMFWGNDRLDDAIRFAADG